MPAKTHDRPSHARTTLIRTRSPNCWRSTLTEHWKRPHANENCVVEWKWSLYIHIQEEDICWRNRPVYRASEAMTAPKGRIFAFWRILAIIIRVYLEKYLVPASFLSVMLYRCSKKKVIRHLQIKSGDTRSLFAKDFKPIWHTGIKEFHPNMLEVHALGLDSK